MENKQDNKILKLTKKENNFTEEEMKLKNDLLEIENSFNSMDKVIGEIKKENKNSILNECEDLIFNIMVSLYTIKLEDVLCDYMKIEREIENEI